jgi:recombination protein RecA
MATRSDAAIDTKAQVSPRSGLATERAYSLGARGSVRGEERPALLRPTPPWSLASIAGRLVEISATPAGAPLTLAFRLVLDAQRAGEPVAWVGRKDAPFYPPDVADAGIDLVALPVVWAKNPASAAKGADLLVRSGAFGLVVVDLGIDAMLPQHAASRLAALAKQHGAAVVCLTDKDAVRPSLGPLVSLRAHATARARGDGGRFRCEAKAIKDKRGKPGWTVMEVCRGPDGLH